MRHRVLRSDMDIKLRFYGPDMTSELQSYDLRVEVVSAHDMPKEIFVWQRKVQSATDAQANQLGDQFVSVADPVDLQHYPTGAPNLDNNMPYYRVDNVTLRFRSIGELEDVRMRIDLDVQDLVTALKIAENLELMEEKTYV